MLDKIMEIKEATSFDFKEYANPKDELAYLFEEWTDYYRLKHAICKAISPDSILEIGVRYGYSAIAFLTASENATYLGIDNNSATFGGKVGAISWAEKITAGYKAQFLLANSQDMKSFPGDEYDFIHVDGQQDGDGTFHDLELAIEKGKYILVDGYFWSKENMLSSTYFLDKYKDFIEYAICLPGYAGELLIKTKINKGQSERGYAALENTYDSNYYLKDCGGYDVFLKTSGSELDARLSSVLNLVNPQPKEEILDIGCGRGELAYVLSLTNSNVTGIDYSNDAIQIAKRTFSNKTDTNLNFVRGDILKYNFNVKFDKIVASDVVEHIEQEALESIFEKVSSLMKKDGVFIIHTAPNKWNYEFNYKKKRKLAKAAGGYLPANPRTYYEDLMHINEQTPARLNRALKKYFTTSYTWVATLPDFGGSLLRSYSRNELIEATSIFAVAFNKEVSKDEVINLVTSFTQQPLEKQDIHVKIESSCRSLSFYSSQTEKVPVKIMNKGKARLVSNEPYPVHISYHWLDENRNVVIFDGQRTKIVAPLYENQTRDFLIDVQPPLEKGKYILQISLVQEHVLWFEHLDHNIPLEIAVEVL